MIGCLYGETVNNFGGVNYLAHFLLAHPEQDLTFGNYIGDGVRGSQYDSFSEPVKRGIRFHRFIDTYTDAHPLVVETRKLFYPTQAKFSGVVLDVLFDHLLAKSWDAYSNEALDSFSKSCYDLIANHPERMPLRSDRFFHYMVANNILAAYRSTDEITRVFEGMDSRTKFTSNMSQSIKDLERHSDPVNKAFEAFFPELIEATDQWKMKH